MLEAIEAEPPTGWPHAAAWAERMRALGRALRAADRPLRHARSSAPSALLGIDPERCVRIPNGFDPETLRPRATIDRLRAAGGGTWSTSRRAGRPGGEPGSVALRRGRPRAVRATSSPVLLYVGRFTAVKRDRRC